VVDDTLTWREFHTVVVDEVRQLVGGISDGVVRHVPLCADLTYLLVIKKMLAAGLADTGSARTARIDYI
jgi:hypothetical protein